MSDIMQLREDYRRQDEARLRWLVAMGALIVAGTLVAWVVLR